MYDIGYNQGHVGGIDNAPSLLPAGVLMGTPYHIMEWQLVVATFPYHVLSKSSAAQFR